MVGNTCVQFLPRFHVHHIYVPRRDAIRSQVSHGFHIVDNFTDAFGAIAMVLGTFLGTIAVCFFTVILLWFSTDFGNLMIYGFGIQLLHWDSITNFILTYLPPLAKIKALITNYIDYNMFQQILEFGENAGSSKVYTKWYLNALFIAGYFVALILAGWGVFRSKEFN